jgi:hypothetical protein
MGSAKGLCVRNAMTADSLEKRIMTGSQFAIRDVIDGSKRLKMKLYLQIFWEISHKNPVFRKSIPAKRDLQIKYF